MMDTDSLLVFRLQRLRNQPKTFRGRCIVYYADLNEKPCIRILIPLFITILVVVHFLWFSTQLYICFGDATKCPGRKERKYLMPIVLLAAYPLALIPLIIVSMFRDLAVKKEGILAWHRDSIGILVQRFCFVLLLFISILLFDGCSDDPEGFQKCIWKSSVPLSITIILIVVKVVCLRNQRILLWSGFTICLITQMIILITVQGNFKSTPEEIDGIDSDEEGLPIKLKQCLMFFPSVIFGIMIDLQILYSSYKYEPIAFNEMPYPCVKPFLYVIGIASLLMSIISYILCVFVFGGFNEQIRYREFLFSCFIIKSVCWAPFVAMEYYDTFFEQIYHDVKFQLNVVRPDEGKKSPSPLQGRKTSRTASNDQKPVLQSAAEANDKSNYSMVTAQPWEERQKEDFQPIDKKNIESCVTQEQHGAKSKLLIASASDARSLTDNEGSVPDKTNVLDRELNLTEYERNVRAANGLPSSGNQSQGNIESFASNTIPKRLDKGNSLTEEAPQFGVDSANKQRFGNSTKVAARAQSNTEQQMPRFSGPAPPSPIIVGKSNELSGNQMTIEMDDKGDSYSPSPAEQKTPESNKNMSEEPVQDGLPSVESTHSEEGKAKE